MLFPKFCLLWILEIGQSSPVHPVSEPSGCTASVQKDKQMNERICLCLILDIKQYTFLKGTLHPIAYT